MGTATSLPPVEAADQSADHAARTGRLGGEDRTSPVAATGILAGGDSAGSPVPAARSAIDYETLLAGAAHVLDEVDAALDRLSQHTYGVCETCGDPISDARLRTDPTARTCERHLQFARHGSDA